MKKILYITNLPAPYKVKCFEKISEYLALTVVYERRMASDRDPKWRSDENKKSFQEIYLRGINVGNEASLSLDIIKYLRGETYDYILLNGYSSPTAMLAIAFMKMFKIKYGLVCDGMLPGEDSMCKRELKKWLIGSADFWLSSGKITSELLERYGAEKGRVFLYPFSSLEKKQIRERPLSRMEKEEIKKKLNIREEKVILAVGQYIHRKGFDVLIKCAGRLESNVGIYIVGGKPTEEYIKLKEMYGSNKVYFVSFKTKDQLMEYYKAANLFVLPTREDIWGLVINEALAYGLPVVTTKNCGAGLELIEDGTNGYLVETNDEKGLYEAIQNIINNDEKEKEMGIKAIERIKKYSIEEMAKKHVEIFKGLI